MQYVRGVNTEKMGQSGSKQRKKAKSAVSAPAEKQNLPVESNNGTQSQYQPKQSEEKTASTDHPDSGSNGTTDNGKENVVKLRKKQRERGKQTGQPSSEKKLQKRISFYETVDASEILPHLVIGNFPSSKDEEFIVRKNVKYILNLTGELSEGQIEGVEYKSVMIEDEEEEELEPHLEECCKFINKAKSSKDKKQTPVVLVHSYYGISRTSAIVLAYLMKEKQWTLRQAYDHLKERHPSANPNDGFVLQLLRYDQELHDGKMSMTLKDFYQQP